MAANERPNRPAGALLALLLCAPPLASGLVVRAGLIEGYKIDFKFIEKFAFAASTPEDPGTIRLVAWTFIPGQQLLVYENSAWFGAYADSVDGEPQTCESRAARAHTNLTVVKGTFYGEAGHVMITDVIQDEPSFWFLALGRCDSWVSGVYDGDSCMGSRSTLDIPNGIFMYYELYLLNPGGYWTKQFSYDEHGLFEMHVAFCLLFTCFFVWFIGLMLMRWQSSTLFSILGLLTLISAGNFLRHAIVLGHCSAMASSGIGSPWAVYASDLCEYATTVAMIASLMTISKGWMITRHSLKRKTKLLQGFTTLVLCVIYGIMFVVEITERDPAATYNSYESAPARVLAVVRLVVLAWFAWCVKRTYHQEDRPEVRRFYGRFGVVGGFWLVSLPVFSLLISALPSWYRLKTLSALMFTTNAATLGLLGYLTTGHRHAAPVTTVEAGVRDASASQPRLPGNSGPRSVAPTATPTTRGHLPRADLPRAPTATHKVAVGPAPTAAPAPPPPRAVGGGRVAPVDDASAAEPSEKTSAGGPPLRDVDPEREAERARETAAQTPTGEAPALPADAAARAAAPRYTLPERSASASRNTRIHTPASTSFDAVH